MDHLDITDLIDRCDKRLFLNQFDNDDNLNHEYIIDELWNESHNRLDQLLEKDIDLIERAIRHSQLDQYLIDKNYCYSIDQCDNWIHDHYLNEEQVNEDQYNIILSQIFNDPRHITKSHPELFIPKKGSWN